MTCLECIHCWVDVIGEPRRLVIECRVVTTFSSELPVQTATSSGADVRDQLAMAATCQSFLSPHAAAKDGKP